MEYSKEQLELMLHSNAWPDRWAVARKGYGLDVLVHDEEPYVRYAVAEQGYGLEILVNDKEEAVRNIARVKLGERYGLTFEEFQSEVRAKGGIWAGDSPAADSKSDGLDAMLEDAFSRSAALSIHEGKEQDYLME